MAAAAPSPRRRASLVASPTPQPSPNASHIPRPQSASGRYRTFGVPSASASERGEYFPPTATPSSSDDSDKGQVRVVLRVRPSEPQDPSIPPRHRTVLVHPVSPTEVRVSVDPNVLAGTAGIQSTSKKHPSFTFDRVMGEGASQLDMYNATAKERIDEFLRGFNVTFLAYGQTSSGKSYSMGTTGEEDDYLGLSENSRVGLIPRTVETVFRRAEEIRLASGPGATWECRVSFLELYNEDMIDLLSHSGVPVSIREDSSGRIVWSGVREIKVSNVSEVMMLLKEGSARRRTGETNMNATSSRSHAIFSLTLTQARRADSVGAAEDIRSSQPGTPNGRRPMSVHAGSRSTTPVFTRSAPPSSYSKLARPNSVHVGAQSMDDMVILTSKFNMVDLAGSERLKRTAAQGERMKEGISINSGLLALGNVISALAEPAKARGHVPYRDSKLTRLLQDSIGGNAMTTMIACISPLEYNISETLNTINYASRARRIKNSVQKNQQEVGWDDIDHLRNTVTKLRTKISTLETDGPAAQPRRDDDDVLQRQIIDLTDKLADLEDEFGHLQDQYFQKCREIVALSDPDGFEDEDDKLRQFNETIEPVVLEYEKVVASLNGQLAELRAEAALAQQTHEEQASDLAKTQERLREHESYVHELQGRLAKLTERNDSSEAYIRDLETKFRSFTDNDDRQTEVIAGLTQEIQVLKSESSKSNSYISQLEQRIATSEARSGELASLVERYEQEAEQREHSVRELEERLTLADGGNHEMGMLLEELESRDRRIDELETRLRSSPEHLEGHSTVVAREIDLTKTPTTPPDTPPALGTIAEDSDSEADLLRNENEALRAKLREAEHKIEQLQPLPHTPILAPPSEEDEELDEDAPESPNKRGSTGNESSESDTTLQTPKLSSRAVSPQIQEDQLHRSPYVNFRSDFRNSRNEPRLLRPLSLSQGLSGLTYGNSSPRYSWSAPSNGMLAYERSPKFERSPKRQSMPFDPKPLRSVQSLEIDISLLQKTVADREAQLRQREVEIKYLKKTLEANSHIVSTQLPTDDVIERLRQEHADEVEKMYATHQAELQALAAQHGDKLSASEQALLAAQEQHAAELQDVHEAHKAELDDMDARHRGELDGSDDLKAALDAAWEEMATTSRRHQAEKEALTSGHDRSLAELDSRHTETLSQLQAEHSNCAAELESIREQLAAMSDAKAKLEGELQDVRARAEAELAEARKATTADMSAYVPAEEHTIVVQAMEEMERALTAAEDEKRQLKMKAEQARFELSKVRDEHELQRSGDQSRLSELEMRFTALSSEAAELRQVNQDLQRNRDSKSSILDRSIDRSSRTKLPPIGPPPTAPLPPLPAGREAVLSPALTSGSLPRGSHHESGSVESGRSSRYDRPESMFDGDRDEALRRINEQEERLLEARAALEAEQRNNEQFTKDLIELRKTNSKLKVRVDDVNRELAELKRERDGLRRDVVEMKNELANAAYERIADKQRLEGAQKAKDQLQAQLDRMLETKVSRRSDQRLKCF